MNAQHWSGRRPHFQQARALPLPAYFILRAFLMAILES
jgi:hypothetical protein